MQQIIAYFDHKYNIKKMQKDTINKDIQIIKRDLKTSYLADNRLLVNKDRCHSVHHNCRLTVKSIKLDN